MKKILMLDESEVDKISECNDNIDRMIYEITSRGIPENYRDFLEPLLERIVNNNNEIVEIMGD